MKKEVWKDIKGYEGLYQVSNLGRVKSLDRFVDWKYDKKQFIKGKVLKNCSMSSGYLFVGLSKNGKVKNHSIHRLVAKAFIPNPESKPEVNHLDENISNNNVTNLQWVTPSENANYGTRNKKVAEKLSYKTVQLTTEMEFIELYDSLMDASRELKVDVSSIIRVCKGKQNTSMGYRWMYYEDYLDMITRGEVAI